MKLGHIRAWVFDLDNTLYPAPLLYEEIGERMTDYIARALSLPRDEALTIRERYFHLYGATVVGLAKHHAIDPHDFIDYVHDADYSVLAPDLEMGALIERLPGPKIIFTNGGGGHAQRVLERLGLAHLFGQIFDIEAAELAPKPQGAAYERLIAACSVTPAEAVFVEDTLRNLEPAHAIGFTTALVGGVHPEPHISYVDHWARDIKDLLRLALGEETR